MFMALNSSKKAMFKYNTEENAKSFIPCWLRLKNLLVFPQTHGFHIFHV